VASGLRFRSGARVSRSSGRVGQNAQGWRPHYTGPVDVIEAKAALRSELKARLRALPPEVIAHRSRLICAWLAPRVAVGTVLAFAPLADEVNLWPLLGPLAAAGRLVLPRVAETTLTLHRVGNLDSLRTGPLHLREPGPDTVQERIDDVDVALVPGLGFTRAGHRLGRGRGLYDRVLGGLRPGVPRIGVCFAEQVVEAVPLAPHDLLVTELVPAFR